MVRRSLPSLTCVPCCHGTPDAIMLTFFDPQFLQRYVTENAPRLLEQLDLSECAGVCVVPTRRPVR